MAAKGVAPGVRPAEMLALLVVFSHERAPTAVRAAAEKTLGALPEPLLNGALGADLAARRSSTPSPARYAPARRAREAPRHAARRRWRPSRTLARTGERGGDRARRDERGPPPEAPADHRAALHEQGTRACRRPIASSSSPSRNGVALSGHPRVQGGRDRAPERAHPRGERRAHARRPALPGDGGSSPAQLETRADDEDTHDEDEEGEEKLKEKFLPLYTAPRRDDDVAEDPPRHAGHQGGAHAPRARLQPRRRERRHPQPDDAGERGRRSSAATSNIADEVLRVIGSTPEWLKSYSVKKNLVENPKTPVSVAAAPGPAPPRGRPPRSSRRARTSPAPSRTRPAATSTAGRPEGPRSVAWPR